MSRLRRAVPVVLLALLAAACGGGGSPSKSANGGGGDVTTETTAASDEPTTLPPGAVAGLDDYDGDGQPDPTCSTQDFGAGLVLRIPCKIGTENEPESGTILVRDSMYRLPGATNIDLTGISGSIVLARDAAGAKVVIVVFNTDNLFETGSATIGSTDTLDNTIRLINRLYPRSRIQVRGHTDSTGSTSVNQPLSERRASATADYLRSHGVNATEVTAVGLGSSQPLTQERNPDGSDSPAGRRFNRRVEIVIRPG